MYNIEKYIRYCLESCLNQNNSNPEDYEVIVVNDGSTDLSLAIAEEIVNGRSNIRIITQKNAGLSSARNTGLRQSAGEYVWFVDGDDAIAPNAVSILLSSINASHADAYLCNFSTFNENGIQATSSFPSFPVMSGKQFHDNFLRLLPMMAWLTVYRAERLTENSLSFLPGIYHEDKEFSVRAHHCMGSIFQIPDSLYHYRIARQDSIMTGTRKDNTKSLASEIRIIDSFSSFFQNEDTPFTRKVLGMCATTFLIRRYDSSFVTNETTTSLIKDNKKRLYRLMWRSGEWKRRLLLIFIIVMPTFVLCRVLPSIGNRSRLM